MIDLSIGAKIGNLTILSAPYTINGKHSYSTVRCDCGVVKDARRDSIRSGRVVSCGCVAARKIRERCTKHGHTKHGAKPTPEYKSWADMIQRCTNPRQCVYNYYGARGITVCERWKDFSNFFADMGKRPKSKSLERVDNNKGYEPGNCCWATHKEQMQNTRRTRYVVVAGKPLSARVAAKALGISVHRIYWRVWKYGCTHQEAVDHILSLK
jgi:hypothetical protein